MVHVGKLVQSDEVSSLQLWASLDSEYKVLFIENLTVLQSKTKEWFDFRPVWKWTSFCYIIDLLALSFLFTKTNPYICCALKFYHNNFYWINEN